MPDRLCRVLILAIVVLAPSVAGAGEPEGDREAGVVRLLLDRVYTWPASRRSYALIALAEQVRTHGTGGMADAVLRAATEVGLESDDPGVREGAYCVVARLKIAAAVPLLI